MLSPDRLDWPTLVLDGSIGEGNGDCAVLRWAWLKNAVQSASALLLRTTSGGIGWYQTRDQILPGAVPFVRGRAEVAGCV